MSSVRADLHVSGVVQGVGYRYYCYHRARNLNLTGWVRNSPDRTVHVVVEGNRGEIEAFIDELKVGPPASHVTDVKIEWQTFTGEFTDFDIAM